MVPALKKQQSNPLNFETWPQAIEIEDAKMKLTSTSLFIFTVSIAFFSFSFSGQVTVDATGPIHQRLRNAGAGSGSGIFRKLQLQIAIEVPRASPNDNRPTEVDFILTNSGKDELTIPISPNPGDFEPADPKVSYTVKLLNLYITTDMRQGILPGGADLYGNRAFPGTLVTLAPGKSVRVLTRVALPLVLVADQTSTAVFVAHAVLNDETIRTVDGQTLVDGQEIGSATSPPYTLKSLFKSPK
jgi:hypothetical protein